MAEGPGTLLPYFVSPDRAFLLNPPGYVDRRELIATVAETITCPTDANAVFFSATADFAVSYNRIVGGVTQTFTATIAGDITDGTGAEINPTQRYLGRVGQEGSVVNLSVVSNAACILTAAFGRV